MRIEERLKESAARHDAHPAVVAGRARHSYAELALKSERLAAALQAGGVARGERVLMFMDDGWEAAVSAFAVVWAGGVLVPVGTAVAGVLRQALENSRPVAVITQSRLAATVAMAITDAPTVRLIVLAGGDRARAGGTCISFEEAVGRVGRVPPLAEAGTDGDAAVQFGDEAPLSHCDLAGNAAGAALPGDSIALPPLAEHAGFVRFLAAVDAGRTMVAQPLFAREDNRRRHGAGTRPDESRFGILDLLDRTMAGETTVFQR